MPTVADLPVVPIHDNAETHLLLQYHEKPPCIAKEFFQPARDRRDACIPLHLYTDGSCQHPDQPTTRFASYAVVMDCCTDDTQRVHFAHNRYLDTQQMPDCFQVVCQSRVQAEQTIPRAEFCATAIASKFPGDVHVHSDSTFALAQIQRLHRHEFDFLSGNHLDVAADASANLHPGLTFHKIKAHQNHAECTNMLALFHSLGNECADAAARSVVGDSDCDFIQSLRQMHAHHPQPFAGFV